MDLLISWYVLKEMSVAYEKGRKNTNKRQTTTTKQVRYCKCQLFLHWGSGRHFKHCIDRHKASEVNLSSPSLQTPWSMQLLGKHAHTHARTLIYVSCVKIRIHFIINYLAT